LPAVLAETVPAQGADVMLDIEALSVAYGSNRVLHGVSLAVPRGEMIALLGSSGCGKTTLLRAISGFTRTEGGKIRLSGRDVTALPPEKRDTGMVFQSYALWPHMTVAQNIGYGLKLRGRSKADIAAAVTRLTGMLGLGGLEQRMVTQLSGGQRQRVALGRVLAINPSLLLLDEPLSNLDARIRLKVRHEIKAIQRELGLTAVMVTHDREEAMVMADRIVVMADGRIAQIGTPEDVYLRPASAFVARFMGAENHLRLAATRAGGGIAIGAGPANGAALLADRPGLDLAGGQVDAFFRAEAARLVEAGHIVSDGLMLSGRIVQASYPGGVYRYAVAVGNAQYLIDDHARRQAGDAVAIHLPDDALYLFPPQAEA